MAFNHHRNNRSAPSLFYPQNIGNRLQLLSKILAKVVRFVGSARSDLITSQVIFSNQTNDSIANRFNTLFGINNNSVLYISYHSLLRNTKFSLDFKLKNYSF